MTVGVVSHQTMHHIVWTLCVELLVCVIVCSVNVICSYESEFLLYVCMYVCMFEQ